MKRSVIGAVVAGAVVLCPVPQAHAEQQTVEGCMWDFLSDNWIYSDGDLCRGTGEDPTVDSAGMPACANHRWAMPDATTGRVMCVRVQSTGHGHGGHHK